jgi:structural maintenance of chromosome 4
MKPKGVAEGEIGFLEYLEDIIGTRHYVTQIQESERELELLGEERAQKLTRVKVAEKERDSLKVRGFPVFHVLVF